MKQRWTVRMKEDWDQRALIDAMHYICSERRGWTLEEFLQSGLRDFQQWVQPVFERYRFSSRDKTMLEIGCGIGRMTWVFAEHFARVYALDVSPEMIEQGRRLLEHYSNVEWAVGNGQDLCLFPDCHFDFVFSFLVFHHMPQSRMVLRYIEEMLRVLRPGGMFLFQFNSARDSGMRWYGRWFWQCVDLLDQYGTRRWLRRIVHWLGYDPALVGRTWRGAKVKVPDVLTTIWRHDGVVAGVDGWHTHRTWCFGWKVKRTDG